MVRVIYHYSSPIDSENPWPLLSEFGESNTDQSGVRPDISSARAVVANFSGDNNRVGVYDFSDGVDTEETLMTFLRSKSLDITEIDQALQYAMKNAESLKQEDVKKFIDENQDKDKKSLLDSMKKFFSVDDTKVQKDVDNVQK